MNDMSLEKRRRIETAVDYMNAMTLAERRRIETVDYMNAMTLAERRRTETAVDYMNAMTLAERRRTETAVDYMNAMTLAERRRTETAVDYMNAMTLAERRSVKKAVDIVAERLQPAISLQYEPLSKHFDASFHSLCEVAVQLEQYYQEISEMSNHLARSLQQTGLSVGSIFENASQISRIPIQLDQELKAAANLRLGSLTTAVQPAKRDAMSVNWHAYRPFINPPKGRPLLEIADNDSILKSSNSFFWCIDQVPEMLANFGFPRAANEMQEAIHDLRRVPPDCTGAMQHAGAALEAIARSISGKQKCTFGQIKKLLDLPPPMDDVAHKLWGFVSENGRHIREDRSVDFATAKFSVICICAVCEFLGAPDAKSNYAYERW